MKRFSLKAKHQQAGYKTTAPFGSAISNAELFNVWLTNFINGPEIVDHTKTWKQISVFGSSVYDRIYSQGPKLIFIVFSCSLEIIL